MGSPRVGWVCVSRRWSILPEGVGVGRCRTGLVSHSLEWEELWIDMQLEGCLVFHVLLQR